MSAAPAEVPEEKFIQEQAPAPDQAVLAAAAAHEAKLKAAVVAAKAKAASAKLAALQAAQDVAHAKDTAKQHEKQSAKAPVYPRTPEILAAWGEAPQAAPGSELIQEDDETHANPVAAAAAAREAKIKAQLLAAKAQAAAAKVAALQAAGDVTHVQHDIRDHKKAQAAEKAKAALAAWNGDRKFDAGKAKASQFINSVWGAPPAHPKKLELPVAVDAIN